MTDDVSTQTAASRSRSELADCCQWVADAYLLDDPQEEAQALAELFRHLVQRGWIATPAASLLLQLQDAREHVESAR